MTHGIICAYITLWVVFPEYMLMMVYGYGSNRRGNKHKNSNNNTVLTSLQTAGRVLGTYTASRLFF